MIMSRENDFLNANALKLADWQYDSCKITLYFEKIRGFFGIVTKNDKTAHFVSEENISGIDIKKLKSLNTAALSFYFQNVYAKLRQYSDGTYGLALSGRVLGGWGRKVHRTKTIGWAKELGFNSSEAEILGDACANVDKGETSPVKHWSNRSAQSLHFKFDTGVKGVGDSRILNSLAFLDQAIEAQKRGQNQENVLKFLGQGLHPEQDCPAHTEAFVSKTFKVKHHLFQEADNPKFIDCSYDSDLSSYDPDKSQGYSQRYTDTRAISYLYLLVFLSVTGIYTQQKVKEYFDQKISPILKSCPGTANSLSKFIEGLRHMGICVDLSTGYISKVPPGLISTPIIPTKLDKKSTEEKLNKISKNYNGDSDKNDPKTISLSVGNILSWKLFTLFDTISNFIVPDGAYDKKEKSKGHACKNANTDISETHDGYLNVIKEYNVLVSSPNPDPEKINALKQTIDTLSKYIHSKRIPDNEKRKDYLDTPVIGKGQSTLVGGGTWYDRVIGYFRNIDADLQKMKKNLDIRWMDNSRLESLIAAGGGGYDPSTLNNQLTINRLAQGIANGNAKSIGEAKQSLQSNHIQMPGEYGFANSLIQLDLLQIETNNAQINSIEKNLSQRLGNLNLNLRLKLPSDTPQLIDEFNAQIDEKIKLLEQQKALLKDVEGLDSAFNTKENIDSINSQVADLKSLQNDYLREKNTYDYKKALFGLDIASLVVDLSFDFLVPLVMRILNASNTTNPDLLYGNFNNREYCLDEYEILPDGDCGFKALDLNRDEVVTALLSQSDDMEVRKIVAEEIVVAMFEHTQPTFSKSANEEKQLKKSYDDEISEFNKLANQIKQNILTQHPEHAATLTNLNPEDFLHWLSDNSALFQSELNQLNTGSKKIEIARKNLYTYAQRKDVFEAFIKSYTSDNGLQWLTFIPGNNGNPIGIIDALVKLGKILGICIWRKTTQGKLEVIHSYGDINNAKHLLHTDENTHFSRLKVEKIAAVNTHKNTPNTSLSDAKKLAKAKENIKQQAILYLRLAILEMLTFGKQCCQGKIDVYCEKEKSGTEADTKDEFDYKKATIMQIIVHLFNVSVSKTKGITEVLKKPMLWFSLIRHVVFLSISALWKTFVKDDIQLEKIGKAFNYINYAYEFYDFLSTYASANTKTPLFATMDLVLSVPNFIIRGISYHFIKEYKKSDESLLPSRLLWLTLFLENCLHAPLTSYDAYTKYLFQYGDTISTSFANAMKYIGADDNKISSFFNIIDNITSVGIIGKILANYTYLSTIIKIPFAVQQVKATMIKILFKKAVFFVSRVNGQTKAALLFNEVKQTIAKDSVLRKTHQRYYILSMQHEYECLNKFSPITANLDNNSDNRVFPAISWYTNNSASELETQCNNYHHSNQNVETKLHELGEQYPGERNICILSCMLQRPIVVKSQFRNFYYVGQISGVQDVRKYFNQNPYGIENLLPGNPIFIQMERRGKNFCYTALRIEEDYFYMNLNVYRDLMADFRNKASELNSRYAEMVQNTCNYLEKVSAQQPALRNLYNFFKHQSEAAASSSSSQINDAQVPARYLEVTTHRAELIRTSTALELRANILPRQTSQSTASSQYNGEIDIFTAAYANDVEKINILINACKVSPNSQYSESYTLVNGTKRFLSNLSYYGKEAVSYVEMASAVFAPVTGIFHWIKRRVVRFGLGYAGIKALDAFLAKNGYNKTGWTPLHFAAVSGAVDAAKALLENGANPLLRDNNNRTFLDIANQMGSCLALEAIGSFSNLAEHMKNRNFQNDCLKFMLNKLAFLQENVKFRESYVELLTQYTEYLQQNNSVSSNNHI
jgi:hypothetical protein